MIDLEKLVSATGHKNMSVHFEGSYGAHHVVSARKEGRLTILTVELAFNEQGMEIDSGLAIKAFAVDGEYFGDEK